MIVIVDTNNNLVSITGLTVEQRDVIINLDDNFELNCHWRQGKSGWYLKCMNWDQVCWLTRKLTDSISDGCDILDALDVAVETRIDF